MKMTLAFSEVVDQMTSFEVMGSGSDAYSLCRTLAEWLEDLEEDTGEEMELDPIALRCEFSAYTLEELQEMYTIPADEDPLEWLNDHTIVIETDVANTYIIQDF